MVIIINDKLSSSNWFVLVINLLRILTSTQSLSKESSMKREFLSDRNSSELHLQNGFTLLNSTLRSPFQIRDGILERVPPSRPSPSWSNPTLSPSFSNKTDTKIFVATGHTAYLPCSVTHLGDKVVTWIRKKDVHVLTTGLFTFTNDGRFTSLHSEEHSNDWTLRITEAKVSDSGVYECQISTEPKISNAFNLHVVEATAHIDGPSEIHMISGSNINLTCRVSGSPEPPQNIFWYQGTTLINYSPRGGISVVTDKHARTSRLILTRATIEDSGNYTCLPANAQAGHVSVYILSGEHPAAMQGGYSTALHSSKIYLVIFSLIWDYYR